MSTGKFVRLNIDVLACICLSVPIVLRSSEVYFLSNVGQLGWPHKCRSLEYEQLQARIAPFLPWNVVVVGPHAKQQWHP